ncbi:TRAP transporter substrate-binding protein DctP [Desulfosarcina sp. OttesenSCG-928-A07]|nr:TRAP transporter substrate-binding protein DctP [Desulfosarcina sp. OttesenSCG-928-G17]MDL2328971.1 TRAP transporter substrate-binding protein DctP [Desulfosarcina sp. OttesenSCG-928-A07]
MLRTFLKRSFIVVFFVFISVVLMTNIAMAKSYRLRIQSVYPELSNGGMMAKTFADRINAESNGQIRVKIYWPNQLVGVGEGYNAVSKGLVEGLYAGTIYYTGTVEEAKAEWLPMSWTSPEMAFDLYYNEGFMDYLRSVHKKHGAYCLATWFTGTMGFMTNFEVNSLADFKGKKIRAVTLDAPVVKEMGGTPVALAGTEIYMGLQRKSIDGTIYPYYVLETYKLYEVVSSIVLPGVYSPNPTSLFINDGFYQSLPPDLQALLEKVGKEVAALSVSWSNQWDQDAFSCAEKRSVRIVTLSDSDLAKFTEMARKTWDDVEMSASPECKEGIQKVRDYLKRKQEIQPLPVSHKTEAAKP